MSVVIRSTLLAGLCMGVVVTAAAQKASGRWSANHSHHQGHRDFSAAVLNPSRPMNADLTRLENQTAKAVGSQRWAPGKASVPSAKLPMTRDRGSNPPMNFQYRGPKNSISRPSGGTAGGNRRVGPRVR